MKSSLTRALIAVAMLVGVSASASAETFYVGCNMKGLDKLSPEQVNRVFFNRLANNGRGNGGESIDVLLDLLTGNVTVTCTKTASEDTGGSLYVQLPDGTLFYVGSFPEYDPNK